MKKILIGGSPCTRWSIAQKKDREIAAEGIGWELFENYLIAKEKFEPDFFLYENNKSAAQPIKDQISLELGVPLQYINSSLVSAQNRQRFYAHNIPDVIQPEDRGILLRDILETSTNEQAYSFANIKTLSEKEMDYMVRDTKGKYSDRWSYCQKPGEADKALCITANIHKGVPYNVIAEPIRIGIIENEAKNEKHDSKQYRVYSPNGKATTICGQGGGVGAKTGLYACPVGKDDKRYPIYEVEDGLITIKDKQYPIKLVDGYYMIRKLTVTECCRLQTMPDDYMRVVSASQGYKGLGNGWTAEVIIHILKHMNIPLDEEIVVLSMYDGIGTGRYCLDKLGYKNVKYYAYEIDKYAMQVAMSNYPDIIQCGDAFQVREDDWNLII
jgi:DNA (cytosine-5)-methyltransferase 3A